jgi:A/G-specific adenine glycosylase
MSVAARVKDLSDWFRRIARPLPWRATRDPYRIWVSEIMLQQTQVAAVIPFYERFLTRFPDMRALAEADEQEVLTYWSGLGYYSRARNLRRGAQYVLAEHSGVFPRTREQALAIPGVGPYTAGAILSIAYDLAEPLVDGNVQRVFARYFAFEALLESKQGREFFWSKAREWVDAAHAPRFFNQALMELGATVCTKASPKCLQCPLMKSCAAYRLGSQADFPKRKPRRAAEKLWWASLVQENAGRVLLVQNAEGDWWQGLWDFPRLAAPAQDAVESAARGHLKSEAHLKWERILPAQEHTVTHHRIHVSPIVLRWSGKTRSGKTERWVSPQEAAALPLSALAKKILSSYQRE